MDTTAAKAIGNPVLSTFIVLPWHFGHNTLAILTASDKGTLTAMPYQEQCLISGSHKKFDFTQDGKPTYEAVSKLLREWNEQLDINTAMPRLNEVCTHFRFCYATPCWWAILHSHDQYFSVAQQP